MNKFYRCVKNFRSNKESLRLKKSEILEKNEKKGKNNKIKETFFDYCNMKIFNGQKLLRTGIR